MHRRQRQKREMAGWQCAAGRAILRLEARELAPLAGTTRNTILRFESGEFMPRPATVVALERAFRDRGVRPLFDMRGEPKGVNISWEAYKTVYPVPERKHRLRPEEIGARMRQREAERPTVMMSQPDQEAGIAALEEQQRRILAELDELRRVAAFDDEDDDAPF